MLAELLGDIGQQTWPDITTQVGVDRHREGPAIVRNRLVAGSDGGWLAFVDDDDRIDPHHIATLIGASDGADVIWSYGRVEGRWPIAHDCNPETLRERNTIPVTALVRRSMFVQVGGFPEDMFDEDWGLWVRILDAGGRFQCVHTETWTYRFHGTNRTYEHP
jgi:glycosyltransferase involved in cell wall biosynthesis